MTGIGTSVTALRGRWRRVAFVPALVVGLLAAPSLGQENWVRFEFRLRDATSGAPVNGRIHYLSDQAADWFHPDNTQPLLPPGTYRLVAWEREYWQTEESFVVDPRNGLRQQKTMSIQQVSPKDAKGRRTVPAPLRSLVVVGNAGAKAAHSNYSHFVHSNIGDVKVYWDAWSEYPGEPGRGSRISSANARFEFSHDAASARKRFEFFRQYFKLNPSKGDRFTGPVSAGLGEESILYRVDRPRGDGGSGWLNQIQKILILTGNVVIDMNINQQLGSPALTSAEEMVRRVKALDMPAVKRLMEPEPFPWPKRTPTVAGGQQTTSQPGPGTSTATGLTPGSETPPPEEVPPQDAVADMPFTPEELATAAGLAGGAALIGSLLLMGAAGVRRDEVIESIRDLLRGRLPDDPFEAWKKKYEALGWRYREKNGVASFDPVEGARNEAGEVYSSSKGGFVKPDGEAAPVAPTSPPRVGDVNARGEVWSSFSGGYVDRRTYDQDMASRADLADKARRDLADMARPDADVTDLHRVIADTRRQGEEMRTFFSARDQLMDALADQRRREGIDAVLDRTREGFLDDLGGRLLATPDDFRKGLENLVPLADVIGKQMRPGYQPTYTYRDAVEDTLLQTGALALDAVLTRGAASSAVGGGLAMRDAVRDGADTAGILAAGAKALATDYLFGKAAHLGAGLAGDALQAARGAAHTVADTVSDALAGAGRRSNVASDLVERMKRSLDTLDAGVHRESSGRLRASLSDVLDVQRNPHQVRALNHSGSSVTKEAFDNTLRNEVYRPHDQMLLEKLRQSSPDLADKKLIVHEVRTPGKAGGGINTDRDFRVLAQDPNGQWIEVPKTKWEGHSHDAFAELTYFDSSKCPKGLTPAQQKAWWAEQHGHTPTDRAFREAGRDYSDQAVDAFGRRTQVDKPRIAELKDIAGGKVPPPAQKVTLADPQGFAHQFHEKVTGNLRRGDPFEAIAQAKKGVETLDTVRTAYGAQKIATGALPSNLRQAMDVVKASDLPRLPDAAALGRLEADLGRLGFAGLDDFSAKLSSQFEGLKWAR